MAQTSSAEFRFERGNAHFNGGAYDEAISEYVKAIEIDPNFAKAYCNLGLAYQRKGLLDLAVDSFSKAVELRPESERYRRNLESARKELDAPSKTEQSQAKKPLEV